MVDKSDEYACGRGFVNQYGKVTYLSFSDVYAEHDTYDKDDAAFRVKQFIEICYKHSCGAMSFAFWDSQAMFAFQKSTSYWWQNEWRFVLKNEENDIITTEKDCHVMSIGRLKNARILEMNDILNATIDLTH